MEPSARPRTHSGGTVAGPREPRAKAAETSTVGNSGPGNKACPSSSSTTASSERVKPWPPWSSGRCRPSQPWAAIFSHAAGRSPDPGGASATSRGTVAGEWVWAQRSAVVRSDS